MSNHLLPNKKRRGRLCALLFLLCTTGLIAQQTEVTLVGRVTLDQMSQKPALANDVWGFQDGKGNPYAILGSHSGTTVFDLSNPSNPREIGTILGVLNLWRDVKTYVYNTGANDFRAYAFVTTEGEQGMQVIDLSDVPNKITEVKTYQGFSSAHNIFIHPEATKPYAYVLGSHEAGGGALILDISNPTDVKIEGRWSEHYIHDFFTHDQWADDRYNGKDIGIGFCGRDNISIIDLTDKKNPRTIADTVYNDLGYAHSGWVDNTGRYLYAFDELDELGGLASTTVRVIDLIDLENPRLAHVWEGPSGATDHNGFVKGNHLYISNYSRGFTLLDISRPTHPFQSGYFDTFSENDLSGFNGAWGCFPYLPDNLVAISDFDAGLFILRVDLPPFRLNLEPASFTVCPGETADLELTVNMTDPDKQGPITVRLGAMPENLSVEPTTFSVSAGEKQMLRFSANSESLTGSFPLELTLSDGNAVSEKKDLIVQIGGGSLDSQLLLPVVGNPRAKSNGMAFDWSSTGVAGDYQLELSRDPFFEGLDYVLEAAESEVNLAESLEKGSRYFWRVKTESPCGSAAISKAGSFFTAAGSVLVVNDTGETKGTDRTANLLHRSGISFDTYHIASRTDNGPDAATMAAYPLVIWLAGENNATSGPPRSGPTAADEEQLATFLDGGGLLLIAAQDYARDRGGVTDFMRDRLGIHSIAQDVPAFMEVTLGGDWAFIDPYDLIFGIGPRNFFDYLTPNDSGEIVAHHPRTGNGIAVRTARTVFFAMPFDILARNNKNSTKDILNWLDNEARTAHPLVTSSHFLYLPINPEDEVDASSLILMNPNPEPALLEIISINEVGFNTRENLPFLAAGGRTSWNLHNSFGRARVPFRWVIVGSDQPIVGYLEGRESGKAFAMPLVDHLESRLIVPHIATDTASFQTVASFINGGNTSISPNLTTPDGSLWALNNKAVHGAQHLDFEELMTDGITAERGQATVALEGAQVEALAGAELFGTKSGTQLAGLALTGGTSRTLVFSHIASVTQWWTGLVVVNPGEDAAELTLSAYDGDGNVVASGKQSLAAGGKIVGVMSGTQSAENLMPKGLPSSAVWLEISSSHEIAGYELFGDNEERMLAGFQAGQEPVTSLIFPFMGDTYHWAGMAMTNPGTEPLTLHFSLYENSGRLNRTTSREVPAKGRLLAEASQLFKSRPEASYMVVEGDSGFFGFQLYGPGTSKWLCGLNGLALPQVGEMKAAQ